MTDTLEDTIKGAMQEKNAGVIAVETLTSVKDKGIKDFGSDVEIKTELNQNECLAHALVDEISLWLNMNSNDFMNTDVLSSLIQRKERKLLSKDRKSRGEVVEVARARMTEENEQKTFMKRMFSPMEK
jgi:hypothetical protein